MKVDDGRGEWFSFIRVMISSNRKDIGAVIGFGRFKDEVISIIPHRKDEIHLSRAMMPVKFISIGYEEEFHTVCAILGDISTGYSNSSRRQLACPVHL